VTNLTWRVLCDHPRWTVVSDLHSAPEASTSVEADGSDGQLRSPSCPNSDVSRPGTSARRGGFAPTSSRIRNVSGSRLAEPVMSKKVESSMKVWCEDCGERGVVLFGNFGGRDGGVNTPDMPPIIDDNTPRNPLLDPHWIGEDDSDVEIITESTTLPGYHGLSIGDPSSNAWKGGIRSGVWVSAPGEVQKRRKCSTCKVWFPCGRRSKSSCCTSCRNKTNLAGSNTSLSAAVSVGVLSPIDRPTGSRSLGRELRNVGREDVERRAS